ncbi:helix-turn-helix domain-containing protein [Acetobacterium bakii]|uniref:helix-turn-helix domain-containing protein n=1 Tax=Acetobacterium bakii TaxID=52689 RepID=UPI000681D51D|nr:helix-turn-helix domain-containing protein [Acetobacterium bakii]
MINYFVISSNPLDGEMFNHLFKYNSNIQYSGQAFSFNSGLTVIKEKKPRLVFLEIKPIDNTFYVDIVKMIKDLDPSNFLICFSISEQFELLQSAMDFGAYSFLSAPIDRKRIIRIVENINKSVEKKEYFFNDSANSISYKKIFLDCLNCTCTELEIIFDEIWDTYLNKEEYHFSRVVNKCQKFCTELYYYLIDTYVEKINETVIIIYNNFMLEITKIKTKIEIKSLLYNFIKDCNCTINKDQQDLSRELIIKAKKLISQYINEEKHISLETIAVEMFMSPSYLSRIFRKVEGIKYIDYVNFYRLDKAKVLLSTTNNTIENIACICGYNEPNSFRRLFKQKLGMTPNTYRKVQGKNDNSLRDPSKIITAPKLI